MAAKAEEFIAELTKEAVAAANHAGRKVIRAEDIDFVTGAE
jgi:histone H3/H4